MTCPSCGRGNRADARFCDGCGSRLATAEPYAPPEHLADKLRTHAERARGERKQVTVLFADVSGSMDLAEAIDAETWRRIMDRFFSLLCDGVHRYEGTVVQFTGDGIMALFGAPIAHEDHAVRAAHAALRLTRDLADHAAQLRRDEGVNFSVRIGLNSGEVVVGGLGDDLQVEFTAIGHTVGLAKRMEALAEPGRAYLTGHTRALLDGYFELRDLGRFDVKGVREPVDVYELAGLGRARTRLDVARDRGFSRFVGRDRELELLEAAVEAGLAGDGRIIGVVGEAGVGKSRLCHELAERFRARGVPVYWAGGAAHARKVPFHAALEMLRDYFGIEEGDPPQVARERIAGRLLLLDATLTEQLPLIWDFLGVADPARPAPAMDPDARLRRLLDAARSMVAAQAVAAPALMVLEDLHWIDAGSAAFLDALVEAIPGRRAAAVVNFRPGFTAAWTDHPAYTHVELVPLGAEAVDDLLEHLLGNHPSLAALGPEILRRTGGNPLFVEELVHALVEDGTLVGERGARRLARPLEAVTVPPSVHAVLAARLDRLPAREKAVAQAAAVAGAQVREAVVQHMLDRPVAEVADSLGGLVDAGFLREDDDGGFAFRHALTQDVAYASQLSDQRRRLHAAAAQAEAALAPDQLDERAALIAEHWTAAGEPLESARWHARAAAWAGTRSPAEGERHWRAVIDACDGLPETPETLGLGMAARIWVMQTAWRLGLDADEVDTLFAQGRRLAARLDDQVSLALTLAAWGSAVALQRNIADAVEALDGAMELIRDRDRPDVEVALLVGLSYARFASGRYAESFAACARAFELLEHDRTLGAGVAVADPYAWTHMLRGSLHTMTGDLRAGVADLERGIELCAASGDLETAGWCHMTLALVGRYGGVADGTYDHALRSVEIAESIGSPFSRAWARLNLAGTHLVHGRVTEALAEADDGLRLVEHHGTARDCEPWLLMVRATAAAAAGDPGEAEAIARGGLAMALERGVMNVVPDLHNVIAAALARQGRADEALSEIAVGIAECTRRRALSVLPLLLMTRADCHATAGDHDAERADLAAALDRFERNGAAGHAAAVRERLAAA